jgi:hypothetical protein
MKISMLVLCLMISNLISAQNKFNRFVEGKKIQWAADFTDTFHFSNPNLSEMLRMQLLEGKIKAGLIEDQESMAKISYENLTSVLYRMRPNAEIAPAAFRDSLFSGSAFDTQTKDLVEIRDIIYIEKGKLNALAYAVSPKYTVQTSWGMVLGISNLFTTAFNDKKTTSRSVLKKAIPIGSSRRRLNMDEQAGQPLKQLYGQNLLDALWPYLGSKNYEIYRIDSNKRISVAEIGLGLLDVPVYDVNGNMAGKAAAKLTPESFSSLEILQNWSYHKEKNLLFGRISEIILYFNIGSAEEKFLKPLVRILVK